MITSNNLKTHLDWVRLRLPQIPNPEFVALAIKPYPKDKSVSAPIVNTIQSTSNQPTNPPPVRSVSTVRPQPQIVHDPAISSDDFDSDDDIIDLTLNKLIPIPKTKRVRSLFEAKEIPEGLKKPRINGGITKIIGDSRSGILNMLGATPYGGSPREPITSTPFSTNVALENINKPETDTQIMLLETLVVLQDSKLQLYEEKFSVSESTSISLDAKKDFYKNKFDPKLASLSLEITAVKKKIAANRFPHTSTQTQTRNLALVSEFPINSVPNVPNLRLSSNPHVNTSAGINDTDFNTFGFSDSEEEAIIAAAAKSVEMVPEPVEVPDLIFKVPETPVRKSLTPRILNHTPISVDEDDVHVPKTPISVKEDDMVVPETLASRNARVAAPRGTALQEADHTLEEDHFGDRTFDGLSTPTQERDEVNDLGDFIDGQDISDGEASYKENSEFESDTETVGEDITAEDHARNFEKEATSDIEFIEDGSTQKDSMKRQIVISNVADFDEDNDDIEEIEDFTTQLNEERELTNGEIIELISDGEDELNFFPDKKLTPVIENIPDSPVKSNVENAGDSDFSDDDDLELMELLNNNQKIAEKENIPPGSDPFIKEVYEVLNSVFKLKSFRQNQLNAVCASLQSKDVFVLMPTGGGKSLCYQLPALIQGGKTKGTTVVISPLISLMQDQVQHLLDLNVKAGMISSKATSDDNKQTLNLFRDGFLQIVYLSPEKANKSTMIQRIIGKLYENNQLARVVIDEAHCLSSWGHDFRPDYQGMGFFKEKYPKVPLMALTATANEKVRMDIVHHLKMSLPVLLKQSFNRGNLFYEIKWKSANYVEWIKDYVLSKHNGKTGIIYCHSKQSCEQTSEKLNLFGLNTSFYHAGMSADDRSNVQRMWQQGNLQLICATIAFGMGIDKPNVRFVIHLFIPRSLEGYYQETGRAGRDGNQSDCIMFYSYKDARSLQNMIQRDEELTREGKENHLAKLRQVVQYCENTTDCRRKQVLHYFNESFNPIECRKQCDNCLNSSGTTTVEKNCTLYAKDIINLVQSIQDDQVTVLHCQDVFKGSNSNKILKMGHNNNPYHGNGRSLDKTDVERIFFYLLSEDCLLEYQIMKGGFASNYVRIGKLASQVLRGQKEIKIGFSSSKSVRPTSNGATVCSSTTNYGGVTLRASTFGGNSANTLNNFNAFVTARQLSNGDFNAIPSTNSIISLPQNQFGSEIKNHASRQHIESSYKELCKIRIETLSELGISLQQIVSDSTITEMAIKLPTNKKDFSSLSGILKEQLEYFSYFKKILGTLSRERKKSTGDSANTSVASVASSSNQTVNQLPKINNVSPYFNLSQQDLAILQTLRGSMSQSDNILPVASIKPGTKGYRSAGKKFYKAKSQRSRKRAPGNTQNSSRPSGVTKPRAMPL